MPRQGQPDSEEGCIMLQSGPIHSLIAKCSTRPNHRLHYVNFVLQGKNAVNEATDGYVQTFDAWCCGAQSASEQLQLPVCELNGPNFGFITQKFSMVAGYTENAEKPQNCQN